MADLRHARQLSKSTVREQANLPPVTSVENATVIQRFCLT